MTDLERVMAKLIDIEAMLGHRLRPTRREPSAETRDLLLTTVAEFYKGMCPSCGTSRIIVDGQKTGACHLDHWTDNPSNNAPHELWFVCAECNGGFRTGRLKRCHKYHAFAEFQARMWVVLEDRQMILTLGWSKPTNRGGGSSPMGSQPH